MDADSSTKFIGSLTKFLQSLCNGYVEFQRGVELVGHIYLSIDTGEKVDYVLHEKVNKNDENSVTFVSNSFHAIPPKSDQDKTPANKSAAKPPARSLRDTSDDDDIMIVDNKGVLGSTNSGTIPSRGMKRTASPGGDQRQAQRKLMGPGFNRGAGSNPMSSPTRRGPASTVTSQDSGQQDISMGEMKLEQLSADELLSLASQVGEGSSSGPGRGPIRVGRSASLGDAAGQPVWIKQEAPDDPQGGSDTGWPHGRDGQSDSSNSSSNLYPVMMHQNPAFSSAPVFPGFPSMSGPNTSASSHHGLSQSLPGTSGASSFGNPMSGSSGGIDPAAFVMSYRDGLPALRTNESVCRNTKSSRLYRQRIKQDPVLYQRYKARQLVYRMRHREKRLRQIEQIRGILGSGDDDDGFPSDLMDVYQKNMAMHITSSAVEAASNLASSPIRTTSNLDPSSYELLSLGGSQTASPAAKKAMEMRRYRERLRKDPVRYRRYLDKQNEYARKRQEKMKSLGHSPDQS